MLASFWRPQSSSVNDHFPVSAAQHTQLEHIQFTLGFHRTVLPNSSSFCFFSRAPQTEMSAAGHPLSVRRKRHHSWLFRAGLKQSQNVGLGQRGIKTLFCYMLPYRFWSSQIWNNKVEVRAQMQNWQTTEGVTWGISSCTCWLYLGPLWSLLIRIFPGCGELFSGLYKSLPYAKIMSNTEGQEFEIYWLGTEMGLLKIEMKVRCDCQITMEMAFNSSTSHERFLTTSIWHSSLFLKDNQKKIGSLLCSKVSSLGF